MSGTGGTALCTDDDTGCKSRICIGNPVFAATMFLIGWTEELIFRGVILNLFLNVFPKRKRDSLGGHSQWCIVRGGTFDKYFTGVTVTSAMIQAINAAFLGVIFGAVYARSGNIWLVMTFHALVDFASLMGSGILELEQLWNRSTRCLPLI